MELLKKCLFMNTSKFFAPKEFQRCVPPCHIDDMDQHFLNVLDAVRSEVGMPLRINSAFRTPEYLSLIHI